MSGSTQGEMNDSTPAPNAARRVTFSTMAASGLLARPPLELLDGRQRDDVRPRAAAAGIHSHLTGGTSWNMKSHFQRSDGFDACSQLRAVTGREN